MLPAHIAQNIRKQILYYLQSTFTFRDKATDQAFQRFIEDPDAGLFKGPWVQLKRPFRPAPAGIDPPFDIKAPFHPFVHQYRAWRRLSAKDQSPQNTIVTTGTGSGKTECFLIPVLDHCRRAKKEGQKGVKAIVLYPMNALAADQEKRFAETVWKNAQLKAAGIRVGNYTGRYDPADPQASMDSGPKRMGPDHGIANHEEQQDNPPDILLTNYRMLDFLLMRPQDARLWRYNEPGVLRYLVLDELHTYDGAQGADVACLIRRLKERLRTPKGMLCVVGTSATLDDRDILKHASDGTPAGTIDAAEVGKDRLAAFAETLFGEPIPPEAVIEEDRLTVEEIIHGQLADPVLPDPSDCHPHDDEDSLRYVIRQSRHWGGPAFPSTPAAAPEHAAAVETFELRLGEWLKGQTLFKYVLEIFHRAEIHRRDPIEWPDLVDRIAHKEFAFQKIRKGRDREMLAASFCSLIAHAREQRGDGTGPLVPTQVQLWVRELRRLGRVVSDAPNFSWLDEPVSSAKSLPAFHCSECGESGWMALHDPDQDGRINSREVSGWAMNADPAAIYRAWFGHKAAQNGSNRRSQYIFVISPWPDDSDAPGPSDALSGPFEQLPLTIKDAAAFYLCPNSLVVRRGDGPCPLTGDSRRFRVRIDNRTRKLDNGRVVGDQGCPRCGSREGLFFIGAQSATLSSVAIDEMFGSVLNNDPKLLAFTDSVQDASHRAGFFSARTYHFTFRTALQHAVNDSGPDGLPLADAGRRMLAYWSQPLPGRPGSPKEAMAVLMPPDLQDYKPFVDFRNGEAAETPPGRLQDDIQRRLTWQAVSEFGLMQTHGRTMEKNGAACLGWDEGAVTGTIQGLREKLPGINPVFSDIPDNLWRLWIYGMLHRYRERGALSHPFLEPLAKHGYWGKYPFGHTLPGREIYPPAIRYKPRLMVTAPRRNHEHLLAHTKGGPSPWHIVWAYRALNEPAVAEADILDLIQTLLVRGTRSGLFTRLHKDTAGDSYALSAEAAVLLPGGVHLVCDETDRGMVRPEPEAAIWKNAPSMEYAAKTGRYRVRPFGPRQQYYQDRYHKGALRRVVAEEHTGLLATEEREHIETAFKRRGHEDDPNVLTCTSTLEMGIDIGDLSSTMLCSIPPNTASYLQRIGRAGRATGSALIVSVVNQRPHDLFFYARPMEMLKGKVDPPGCWLDASAVLARQYLGFLFDTGTREGVLREIPRTGVQLVDDLKRRDGHIPSLMAWATQEEAELQDRFLRHFRPPVQDDTQARFLEETDAQRLMQRIHKAANDFERSKRDLENGRSRLTDQLKKLDPEETEARREIEQELQILRGRIAGLNRITALEILTDEGLLPNYAFPERGVRFYGAAYNRHRHADGDHRPVELYRSATAALRELAPRNTFYTHRRQFDIQQIAIGNPRQPLTEIWAICGACGHMRRLDDLKHPDAAPACPQCGHSGDNRSQFDLGQQRPFIEFAQSQALSYMEHYDSLSGDRDEERRRGFYDVIASFDGTRETASGAVGDDGLPFGIEYRASMILREINTGYKDDVKGVPFGPNILTSEIGFLICRHCGVAIPPGGTPETADAALHRRSCQARRKYDKMRQEGKTGQPFEYLPIYLYRELKSEVVRLLLPSVDEADIDTLTACIYLGLRLRFEGNPAHLLVQPQILPESASGVTKHYLVIMDAVPGGTGFLKTLYQEKDDGGRNGEGIMDVLRRARDALETCPCREMPQSAAQEDTDGCYRCIRTYHLQYKTETISRDRGIRLLDRLVAAGERREGKRDLSAIKPDSLFGSLLEKKFVETLQTFVGDRKGRWEETIVRGGQGFRFTLPESDRVWELALQPSLGPAQGVMVQCQPDFLLLCDDDIRPVAIFTDGFEFHCHPNNRLSDDIKKRRAIVESGNYRVWSIAWEDLNGQNADHGMVCHPALVDFLTQCEVKLSQRRKDIPNAGKLTGNGMEQLKAYLAAPSDASWKMMVEFAVFRPLQLLMEKRKTAHDDLQAGVNRWRTGGGMGNIPHKADGEWIYNDRASLTQDVLAYIAAEDAVVNAKEGVGIAARLGDSDEEVSGSDFKERWRRFLACLNLFQFHPSFLFWTSGEALRGEAPDLVFDGKFKMSEAWKRVLDDAIPSLKPVVEALAKSEVPVPEVEYVNDAIDDDAFAELAWASPDLRIAILAGDQADFASEWQNGGWRVILPSDIEARGVDWVVGEILKNAALD
jgi:DEAD/DEAH box helicase domain-containing protein